jgi:gas vesicle protein
MNIREKMRIMLPHWIEHNKGHGTEFSQWAEQLAADSPEIADLLQSAVGSLQEVQCALEEALEKAGGALESAAGDHHHHDHHH